MKTSQIHHSQKRGLLSRVFFIALLIALGAGVALIIGAYRRDNTISSMQDDSQVTAGNSSNATLAQGYPMPMPESIPTVIAMTPVPHPSTDPEQKTAPAGLPQRRSLATSDPHAPVNSVLHGEGVSSTPISVRESSVIILGTVKNIQPARWTTPNGGRPANPYGSKHSSFRPAIVEVEAYLKGQQPMRQLNIFAWGGTVGQDSATMEPGYLYDLQEGERVVLFLTEHQVAEHNAAVNNQPFWFIMEHYTVTPQGEATNAYRTITLDELRAEIVDALRKQ